MIIITREREGGHRLAVPHRHSGCPECLCSTTTTTTTIDTFPLRMMQEKYANVMIVPRTFAVRAKYKHEGRKVQVCLSNIRAQRDMRVRVS